MIFQRSPAGSGDLLILAHGAGGHMEHRTISRLASTLLEAGLDILRFNFAYRAQGLSRPDPMPRLMARYREVIEHARQEFLPRRLFLGGHSMGGRTASMLAAHPEPSSLIAGVLPEAVHCAGLILLAYPLHPVGQPEKLRDAHMTRIRAPVLCLSGTRDDLCRRDIMEEVIPRLPASFRFHWLEGADHGYRVLKSSGRTEDDVFREIGETANGWVRGLEES